LEHFGATRDNKGYGLDVGIVDSLESAKDLVLVEIDTTLGHEGDTSLWVGRRVLGKVLELVIFVFVVADVAITVSVSICALHVLKEHSPFTRKVQTLRAIIPERHTDTRDGIEDFEAAQGLLRVTRIPQTQLTVAHAGETGGCDAVMLAHPNSAAVLRSGVSRYFLRRLLLSHIPYAQFLVSARGDQVCAVGAPRQRLDNVIVLEGQLCGAGLDIPKLHSIVAG
jgi:hypothetical protein